MVRSHKMAKGRPAGTSPTPGTPVVSVVSMDGAGSRRWVGFPAGNGGRCGLLGMVVTVAVFAGQQGGGVEQAGLLGLLVVVIGRLVTADPVLVTEIRTPAAPTLDLTHQGRPCAHAVPVDVDVPRPRRSRKS